MEAMDQAYWDSRYQEQEAIWSGRPNGVLVTEVADLPPGTALDLGSGEGADAIWLAERGWTVVGLDISEVAVRRGAQHAATDPKVAARITWERGDLSTFGPTAGVFDLVSAQYFPLLKENPDAANELLARVGAGGTLLFVGHRPDRELMAAHGFDVDDFWSAEEVAARLDDGWTVEVDEVRPRPGGHSENSPHTHDTVLRARRRTP